LPDHLPQKLAHWLRTIDWIVQMLASYFAKWHPIPLRFQPNEPNWLWLIGGIFFLFPERRFLFYVKKES